MSKSLSQGVLLGIDFVYANQIKLLYHDDHSAYVEFGDWDNIDLVERSCVEVTVKLVEMVKLVPYHFHAVECFI